MNASDYSRSLNLLRRNPKEALRPVESEGPASKNNERTARTSVRNNIVSQNTPQAQQKLNSK